MKGEKKCIFRWKLFLKHVIIIIIIMSCWWHGYPWPSLATPPYRSFPQAGLPDNIPYPHIAAECMFVLVVLLLHGHVWGSIRVNLLWVRPCFSSKKSFIFNLSNLEKFIQLFKCRLTPNQIKNEKNTLSPEFREKDFLQKKLRFFIAEKPKYFFIKIR